MLRSLVRNSLLRNALIVAAVACLAWSLTPRGVAQQQKISPAEPKAAPSTSPAGRMSPMTEAEMLAIDERHAAEALQGIPPARTHGGGVHASSSIRKLEVVVKDGVAAVSAAASLYDRREGVNYIWRLKVSTTDGKTLLKRHYDEQVFSIPESHHLEPTFTDTIAVPSGESKVELELLAFPKQIGLRFLDDEETAKSYASGSAWRKVKN